MTSQCRELRIKDAGASQCRLMATHRGHSHQREPPPSQSEITSYSLGRNERRDVGHTRSIPAATQRWRRYGSGLHDEHTAVPAPSRVAIGRARLRSPPWHPRHDTDRGHRRTWARGTARDLQHRGQPVTSRTDDLGPGRLKHPAPPKTLRTRTRPAVPPNSQTRDELLTGPSGARNALPIGGRQPRRMSMANPRRSTRS